MRSMIFLIVAIILFVMHALLRQVETISILLSIVVIVSNCPLCGLHYNRIIAYDVYTEIIGNI